MSIQHKFSSQQKFIVTSAVIGNALEWFEFSLFGLMSTIFIQIFFPPSLEKSPFLFPFLIILSIIARPIGGFAFSKIGDQKGRKALLIRTIGFLVFPFIITAALPSYKEIGITSSLLLIFIFIMQGFVLGGEFPGSIVYLVESAKNQKKGYLGSWAYFGCFSGMLLAGLNVSFLNITFPNKDAIIWGWRYSYIFCAIIAFATLCFRHYLPETALFKKAKDSNHLDKKSIFDTFHKYKKSFFCGIGLVALESTGYNLIILFTPTILKDFANLSFQQLGIIQTITVLFLLVTIPISGKISTLIGHLRLAKLSIYGLLLFTFPAYLLISKGNFYSIILGHAIMAIFFASYLGNVPALICSLFPTNVRFSGVAAATNISVLVFASLGTVVIVFFSSQHFSHIWPSFYWIVASLLSLWSLTTLTKIKTH